MFASALDPDVDDATPLLVQSQVCHIRIYV